MKFQSILGVVCACVLCPLTAQAASYTITDLGTLGGVASYGYGINASGQVTGYSTIAGSGATHAFLYDASTMDWATANAWAAGLNIGGIIGWRLPTVTDIGNDGCNYGYSDTDCGFNVDTATGEMASMFYDTLDNLAVYDVSGSGPQSGYGLSNTGSFSNLHSTVYWSDTAYAPGPSGAGYFSFATGYQGSGSKGNNYYAWAVHAGDVGTAVRAFQYLLQRGS